MNKFTNPPDSLPGLLGCVTVFLALSAAMTALVYLLTRIGR
jgi:hypothetical protein